MKREFEVVKVDTDTTREFTLAVPNGAIIKSVVVYPQGNGYFWGSLGIATITQAGGTHFMPLAVGPFGGGLQTVTEPIIIDGSSLTTNMGLHAQTDVLVTHDLLHYVYAYITNNTDGTVTFQVGYHYEMVGDRNKRGP